MESCRACVDGAPWIKPTAPLANCRCVEMLHVCCGGGHDHITSAACSYWRGFADAIVQCWFCHKPYEQSVIDRSTDYKTGFLGDLDDETLDTTFEFLASYTIR